MIHYAINRYNGGAKSLFQLESISRPLALEDSETVNSGVYHENDLERFIAILTQMPLTLRGVLLNPVNEHSPKYDKGFLCAQDNEEVREDIRLCINPISCNPYNVVLISISHLVTLGACGRSRRRSNKPGY